MVTSTRAVQQRTSRVCNIFGIDVGKKKIIKAQSWHCTAQNDKGHFTSKCVHPKPTKILLSDSAGASLWNEVGFLRSALHFIIGIIIPHTLDVPRISDKRRKNEPKLNFCYCFDVKSLSLSSVKLSLNWIAFMTFTFARQDLINHIFRYSYFTRLFSQHYKFAFLRRL